MAFAPKLQLHDFCFEDNENKVEEEVISPDARAQPIHPGPPSFISSEKYVM